MGEQKRGKSRMLTSQQVHHIVCQQLGLQGMHGMLAQGGLRTRGRQSSSGGGGGGGLDVEGPEHASWL